jgi:hypothetical protein
MRSVSKPNSSYDSHCLLQISKHHSVVPDNHKFQQMSEMKFPAEYIPVALQLGNNDLSLVSLTPPPLQAFSL